MSISNDNMILEIESVEEKDTSIVCLLRSVFKLIDAIEDAEITAMKGLFKMNIYITLMI